MSVAGDENLKIPSPERSPRTFKGRFGRKVGGLLAVASFLVLLFGTIPLWFSYRILENAERVRRLNQHVRMMEEIHSMVHHLVEAIEGRMAQKAGAAEKIRPLGERLLKESARYEAIHHDRTNGWAERENEKTLFEEVQRELIKIVELASAPGVQGEEMKEKARTLMPRFADMATVHQRLADRFIQENYWRMSWIFSLYYALVVVGFLVIAGGIFWVSRSIVRPVKRLAAAAQEVAGGDFAKRVDVTSNDEVGQLSHSFNIMAARLEEHERHIQGMAALEERERLAREMHDGLAQNIGLLNLKIGELQRKFSAGEDVGVQAGVQALKKTVDLLYNDVRQAIFGLRIMVSRQLGLLPTLTEYLHEFSQQTGIRVDMTREDERIGELPPETEIQLIRIIQEALTNVRKHAGASRVAITFRTAGETLETLIEDDGCGISRSRAAARSKNAFGLQTMDERARSVGGSFEVGDGPSAGTRVTVRLPLAAAPQEARTWTG